jgi:hypothetical protein
MLAVGFCPIPFSRNGSFAPPTLPALNFSWQICKPATFPQAYKSIEVFYVIDSIGFSMGQVFP